MLLFLDRGTIVTWRDGEVRGAVVDGMADERNSRFNDAIADPAGRVLCGAMSSAERKGRLYRLDLDGTVHQVLENVGCSNGMAYSLDGRYLFHTDSTAREIHRYTYDVTTGMLAERTLFASLDETEGLPDGLTMDAEGYLWSARWGDGCVVRYAGDGTVDRRIDLPARKVSSLTFGGPSLGDIYVTTASLNEPDGTDAGCLYRIDANIHGIAEFRSKVGLARQGTSKR